MPYNDVARTESWNALEKCALSSNEPHVERAFWTSTPVWPVDAILCVAADDWRTPLTPDIACSLNKFDVVLLARVKAGKPTDFALRLNVSGCCGKRWGAVIGTVSASEIAFSVLPPSPSDWIRWRSRYVPILGRLKSPRQAQGGNDHIRVDVELWFPTNETDSAFSVWRKSPDDAKNKLQAIPSHLQAVVQCDVTP